MFVSRLCFFRLVNIILGQGLFITMCTLEGHSGTCGEYLQIFGMWGVFFSSFTSWHYGYLCAFFRTIRDAGPRHRCVLVLQIYKFVSFTRKELLYSVSVFSKRTFGLVGRTYQAWTTISDFYFCAACLWCPYRCLLLIWVCAVWEFQERRFPMVLALPPSMGL